MINSFRGENAFLSNFFSSPILGPSELMYATVEHAYQASKAADKRDHSNFSSNFLTPGQAKRLGRTISMRENFDRIDTMTTLIKRKFAIARLRTKLLDTTGQELIEGNNWNDTFWGMCNGIGDNHLGRLLMIERATILLQSE